MGSNDIMLSRCLDAVLSSKPLEVSAPLMVLMVPKRPLVGEGRGGQKTFKALTKEKKKKKPGLFSLSGNQ